MKCVQQMFDYELHVRQTFDSSYFFLMENLQRKEHLHLYFETRMKTLETFSILFLIAR